MVVTIQHAVRVFLKDSFLSCLKVLAKLGEEEVGGVFFAKKYFVKSTLLISALAEGAGGYYQNRNHSHFNASKVKMTSSNTLNKNISVMPDLANLTRIDHL